MSKHENQSYSCGYCEAEFDIVPSNPQAYTDVSYCPFCGGDISEEVEDITDWEE